MFIIGECQPEGDRIRVSSREETISEIESGKESDENVESVRGSRGNEE